MRGAPGDSRFELSALLIHIWHGRPRGGGRIDNACGASPATPCFHASKAEAEADAEAEAEAGAEAEQEEEEEEEEEEGEEKCANTGVLVSGALNVEVFAVLKVEVLGVLEAVFVVFEVEVFGVFEAVAIAVKGFGVFEDLEHPMHFLEVC